MKLKKGVEENKNKKTKGGKNMIKVRTLEVQQRKEVPAQEGMTVEQVLQAAGIRNYNPREYMITVNGQEAELSAPVSDGVLVVVTQKVTNG